MSTPDLLQTALLLGVYVALAGLYGIAYAVARLGMVPLLCRAPPLACALHCVTGLAIVLWTPLQAGWKGLIVASSVAVIAIPPADLAPASALSRDGVGRMIANLAMILTGLWLAYHAIFSTPAGDTGLIGPTAAGVAVILLAAWARRTDVMGWPSGTNMALGLIILALTAAQRTVGVDSLATFWLLLLGGITVAIAALWSILYRPDVV